MISLFVGICWIINGIGGLSTQFSLSITSLAAYELRLLGRISNNASLSSVHLIIWFYCRTQLKRNNDAETS